MYNLFPPKEDKAFVPPATQEYKKSRKEMYLHLRQKLKIKPRYVKSADETFLKGQLISVGPFDVLNFPKKQQKIINKFLHK